MSEQNEFQLSAWLQPVQQAELGPVVTVAVGSLSVADSPRRSGENPEHVRALAATQEQLPPIVVHRQTMRVIDGAHRMRAAKLRGQHTIAVRFFSGTDEDAFVIAVKSNIAHGLPLSLDEREGAAKRIVTSHPHWSDRMIASVSGLSSKTIAEIRRRNIDVPKSLVSKIGRDGRVRPIDSSAGRKAASELIIDNPGLSLRQIARGAGISPETARDVRNRLRRGEDPLPQQGRNKLASGEGRHNGQRDEFAVVRRPQAPSADPGVMVGRLTSDPALRFSETGRTLLRLLHAHVMGCQEWENIGKNVPLHAATAIADVARNSAQMWAEFAEQVERKATNGK